MVKKVLASLGSLIAEAVDRDLVARNVVRDVARSRKRRSSTRDKRKLKVGVDIPSPEEVSAILAHAGDRWRPLFLTAAFTGLRASELRGLRWADVDLKASKLHVTQRADKFNKIGPPKSEAGKREVPFGPMVLNTLREWRLACPKSELDLVFPNTGENRRFAKHSRARPCSRRACCRPCGCRGQGQIQRYARLPALLRLMVHRPEADPQDHSGAPGALHHQRDV